MTIFDALTLIGGLCLFLFGMNVMGESLERRAGSGLRSLLGRLTNNKAAGFLTGLGVTSVIQSSSATTVMVVGFVNSGIMTLRQAINVIMGANVGTTVTAWILSLGGISGDNIFIKLLKPTSFTPILALIGIAMTMFGKSSKKKDTGTILLGFAVLMFGMDTMSDAVSGLADVPAFQQMFLLFKNPILGVLVGAVLTGIIQSSSASVGILQALSSTGAVSMGAAIPIIMGQNIGTCVTAMLSSIGANKNAKRAAAVHLSFNVIGTVVCLVIFSIISAVFKPAILNMAANHMSIAVAHSVFNILCTILLLPMSGLLERLVVRIIPDDDKKEKFEQLDERLLVTPSVALDRASAIACEMAQDSALAIKNSILALNSYSADLAEQIRSLEERADRYEDSLGTYLVKLSGQHISDSESAEISKILKAIGDFERITDHSVNILESAEELKEKNIDFTDSAAVEMKSLSEAVCEIVNLTLDSFVNNDFEAAKCVEPLEQVIDSLIVKARNGHVKRLKSGECTIESGFIWADLITDLERTSDHCSNIAVGVIDAANNNMNGHEALRAMKKGDPFFESQYAVFERKYLN